ncbi:hypothetical protein X801_05775 [Opisthorchis viverrini]|uniref:Uncharacterized protein n=1 Tax=Opisthorchis viverrini TaxID=6198 RepID=A0A1S8WVH1_OPIVI|nr:hypothetical protein X801_05775 [Opisthorchis viverrini]
MYFRRVQLL